MAEIKWPFGAMYKETATAGATVAVTVLRSMFLTIGSAALTAAFTLNLTLGAELAAGDVLVVSWLSDNTARAMTCGTGFKGGLVITPGSTSKTMTATFVYDGTVFHCVGSSLQS